ncbi:ectonucleotide pyrophosphatase/phosphodiesterase [Capnocytophaga catalasegens]|nr:ectonucleotide pyrophosphatase/phosphodiesterase [Capnocytophaga catalasegens]
MKRIIFFLAILMLVFSCKTTKKNSTEEIGHSSKPKNYVLLISFDGFRNDYVTKFDLPNFKKLMKQGSYCEGLISSFPSKTFPNHYSIITGMYPGNHGIVDNKFFSKTLQSQYSIPNRKAVENAAYYGGTPLWQWLQKNGMKTASYFWVGSEAPIHGEHPTYYYPFDSNTPYEKRIEQVIRWFKMPDEDRPRLVTLYFEFVDTVGHHTGTNSSEIKEATLEADRLVGLIIEGINKIDLPITVIITSDHGMIDMKSLPSRLVFLETIEKRLANKASFINNGMHCQVYLKEDADKEAVYQEIKKYFVKKPFVSVYKKEETPEHWHYNKHENIGDILIITDAPYYMLKNKKDAVAKRKYTWGTHGYDPYVTPEMASIFFAVGKNIKSNYKIPPFENVNIYPFITRLLGVDNPPNIDGKTEILAPILK